ncbi:MAG: NAD(P)H-dependent oxidoreductase subunit E [Caldilineales bacterium]|nr:NAD(P)H-dependent oxidoreductase subunit E [Caldilineales bacterium]
MSMTAARTLTSPQMAALRQILQRYRGQGGAYLLPCLHEAQAVTGWLDADTCTEISRALNVPLVQVHEVIEFYTLFYNEPVGRRIVRVCDDPPCFLAGSSEIVRACARQLGVDEKGGTSSDGRVTLEIHPCLGRCEQAPFLMIDDDAHGHVQPAQIPDLLGEGA